MLNNPTKEEFPHSIVLKASAGSGKTHALTLRFVRFLLSDSIKKNSLRNILAITFSNNAASEMRGRILEWLKALSIGRKFETEQVAEATGLPPEELSKRADAMISMIFEQYSDLQVKTIDSFMTGIFKASAVDLGYNPDFEVLLRNNSLIEYAFDIFLRNVKDGSEAAGFLEDIIRRMMESRSKTSGFPWDPSAVILEELKNIYHKTSSTWMPLLARDLSGEIAISKHKLRTAADELSSLIEGSGLERNNISTFFKIIGLIRNNRFPELAGLGMKRPPVKGYKGKDDGLKQRYGLIISKWEALAGSVSYYVSMHAEAYYYPYLRVYEAIKETIECVKKREDRVFIEDINHTLAGFIDSAAVPDVYFRLGETIFHYLVDEFQDTSPVQWKNLKPLIEESLSKYGSLFVVGDTKQAIYGFRDADYRIMRDMEDEGKAPFPSAKHYVHELDTNHRSLQKIIDFTAWVFRNRVAADEKFGSAAGLSGLTDYVQNVKQGNEDKGIVQIMKLPVSAGKETEKDRVIYLIRQLTDRGYGYGDVAILTFENDDVVHITGWLNELSIPFISYSSLDIRRRKIISEILSILRFLDSPLDDLSFSAVLLGEIFERAIGAGKTGTDLMREFILRNRKKRPLYKSFQSYFPELWFEWFEALFRSAGYLPLYDLVTEIYRTFNLFANFNKEEAALVRMIEVVKSCEQGGRNSLRDFVLYAEDEGTDEAEWNIDLPKDTDAVKVMTVHKAKGLGFPVVIFIAYNRVSRGFSYVMKYIGDNGEICLTRLSREIANMVPEICRLYDELEQKEMVNNLNTLYVALTRAEAELYLLCVENEKAREGFHACRFLDAEAYPVALMPEEIYPEERTRSEKIQLEHGMLRPPEEKSGDSFINLKEREWGNYVHAVLAEIPSYDKGDISSISHAISVVNRNKNTAYPEVMILDRIFSFLESGVSEFFLKKDGRIQKTEVEIVDSSGDLHRVDRLLIDPDMITIIEFKTGTDRRQEELYVGQVREYMDILSGIIPEKKIRGMISYVDLMELKEVL